MSRKYMIGWLITMLLSGAVAVQAAPDVLAGWWDPSAAVDVQADGISASKDTSEWAMPAHGSGDDTFGSFSGASHDTESPGSYHNKSIDTKSMAFSLQNTGTNQYMLEYLSLDTFRQYSGAKDQWSLSIVGGDLGTSSNAMSGDVTSISGNPSADESNDFSDLDIDISGLGLLLGVGQSVTLQMDFIDSTPENEGNLFIDNIAVLGSVVTQEVSTTVLAGWWEPSNAVDVTTLGFTASKTTAGWGTPAHGCGDDTFGSFAGASHDAVSPGSFWNQKTTNTLSMQFQLTNGSSIGYALDFFSFDAWRVYSGATDQWSLSIVGGDLGLTNNMLSGTIERIAGAPSADENNDFVDIDINLSDFDLVLDVGESVTFQVDFSDTTPDTVDNLFVDNIAVIGSVFTPQYDNDYDAWAASWGVALGSATNDYDGDGTANLGEYALDGNPTNTLDAGIPVIVDLEGNIMTLVYTARSNDSALNRYLQTSENLFSWTNSGYTVVGTNTSDSVFHAVTNEIPVTADKGFVKLVFEYQ